MRNRRLRNIAGGAIKPVVNAVKKVAKTLGDVYGSKGATALKNLIPATDATARPAWPGEKHAILKTKTGWTGIANYMGPGTNIIERTRRGDPPRTPADKAAQAHDLRYTLDPARSRDADKKFLEKLREIEAAGLDSKLNTKQGIAGIKGKNALQDSGVLDKDAFARQQDLAPADKKLLQNKLGELEQQGYGYAEPPRHIPGKRLLQRLEAAEKKKGKGVAMPGGGKGVAMPGDGKGVAMPGDGKGVAMPGGGLLQDIMKGIEKTGLVPPGIPPPPKLKRVSVKNKGRQLRGKGMHGGSIIDTIPGMAKTLGIPVSVSTRIQQAVSRITKQPMTLHQTVTKASREISPIIIEYMKEKLGVEKIPKSIVNKVPGRIARVMKSVIAGKDTWEKFAGPMKLELQKYIQKTRKTVGKGSKAETIVSTHKSL
jgi:hypothetical protein